MTDLVELLKSFEKAREQSACSVGDFLRNSKRIVGSREQLALIDRDMQLRISQNYLPQLSDYVVDFPHFEASLPAMLQRKVEDLQCGFCPVRDRVGPLPQVIGDFQVAAEASRDQFGVIYDAIQTSINRHVRVRGLFFPTTEAIESAKKLAVSANPCFDGILEFVFVDDFPFICHSRIAGESLQKMLRLKRNRLKSVSVVGMVRVLSTALADAHDLGVAHLNISTSNIVLSDSAQPVLINFGFSPTAAADLLPDWNQVIEPRRDRFRNEMAAMQSDIEGLGKVLKTLVESSLGIHVKSADASHNSSDASSANQKEEIDAIARLSPELGDIIATAIGVADAGLYFRMREFEEALIFWEKNCGGDANDLKDNGNQQSSAEVILSINEKQEAEVAPFPEARDDH